jgi:hypothetical protein
VNRLNNLYFGLATRSEAEEVAGDGSATISELWFEDDAGNRIGSARAGCAVTFCYSVVFGADAAEAEFGFHMKTLLGVEVTAAGSEKLGYAFGPYQSGQTAVVRWALDLNVNAGSYFFGCGVRHGGTHKFMARRVDAIKFPVSDLTRVGGLINPVRGVSVTTAVSLVPVGDLS